MLIFLWYLHNFLHEIISPQSVFLVFLLHFINELDLSLSCRFYFLRPCSVRTEVLCSPGVCLSCQLHLQQQHCRLQEKRPYWNPSQSARGHRRNVSVPAHQIRHTPLAAHPPFLSLSPPLSFSLSAFICLLPFLSLSHSLILLSFSLSVFSLALYLQCSKHIKSLW